MQFLVILLTTSLISLLSITQSLASSLPANFFENYGAPLLIIEPQTREIISANPAATKFYGYSVEVLTTMTLNQLNALDDEAINKEILLAEQEKRNQFIFPHRLATGEIKTVEVHSWPLTDDKGKTLLFSLIIDATGKSLAEEHLIKYKDKLENLAETRYQQLTESKSDLNNFLILTSLTQLTIIGLLLWTILHKRKIANNLAQKNILLEGLLNSLPEAVFFKDKKHTYLGSNTAFAQVFNKPLEEIKGLTDSQIMPQEDALKVREEDLKVLQTKQSLRIEEWISYLNNKKLLIEKIKAPLIDSSGQLQGVIGIARDITLQHQQQEKIKFLAYYDPLTSLPNRYLFEENLAAITGRNLNFNQTALALAILDVDHFKNINDALGHTQGDELLIALANRLGSLLEKRELLARFGGDEFIILLIAEGDDQPTLIKELKKRLTSIQTYLSEPIFLDKQEILLTSSIGVTFDTKFNKSFADLLKEADIALYAAKDAGRATWRSFIPSMQSKVERRFSLEGDLRKAIAGNQLALYLQPKTSQNNFIYGAEALVRWIHPEQGLISPAEFIPLAEETGLILPIGAWVLEETVKLMPYHPDLNFSVNVSPRQFHDLNFVSFVKQVLEDTGANPYNLTLEVTEGLLITDFEKSSEQMQKLQELGINFSIDDFGTGYSSLAYLKRLPINELKIDRSFIDGLPDDSNDVLLVETMMSIAQHLQLTVVAEGVETKEQQEFLYSIGCLLHQGFYYGRPQPAEELLTNLKNNSYRLHK